MTSLSPSHAAVTVTANKEIAGLEVKQKWLTHCQEEMQSRLVQHLIEEGFVYISPVGGSTAVIEVIATSLKQNHLQPRIA